MSEEREIVNERLIKIFNLKKNVLNSNLILVFFYRKLPDTSIDKENLEST